MRKAIITTGVTLAILGAFFVMAAPLAAAGVARPVDSGIDLTLQVAPVFAPGDLVEIHFWVTDNGSLVEPTWPAGWPHAHPPNLGADIGGGETQGLIPIDEPVIWGHQGAFRTTMTAPDVPGLYAVHGAAMVGGVTVFAFTHFQVVDTVIDPAPAMSLALSIAAFAVSAITLALVIVIVARKR